LPEAAPVAVAPAPTAAAPPHDYAFWERQWEKYETSGNLIALRVIADEAPRIFANQARARIAEIEAAQKLQAEERERQARERAAIEQRTAAFRAEGRIKVDAELIHGDSEAARDGWFKPGAGKDRVVQGPRCRSRDGRAARKSRLRDRAVHGHLRRVGCRAG